MNPRMICIDNFGNLWCNINEPSLQVDCLDPTIQEYTKNQSICTNTVRLTSTYHPVFLKSYHFSRTKPRMDSQEQIVIIGGELSTFDWVLIKIHTFFSSSNYFADFSQKVPSLIQKRTPKMGISTAGLLFSKTHMKNQFASKPEGLRQVRDHRWKLLAKRIQIFQVYFSVIVFWSLFNKLKYGPNKNIPGRFGFASSNTLVAGS